MKFIVLNIWFILYSCNLCFVWDSITSKQIWLWSPEVESKSAFPNENWGGGIDIIKFFIKIMLPYLSYPFQPTCYTSWSEAKRYSWFRLGWNGTPPTPTAIPSSIWPIPSRVRTSFWPFYYLWWLFLFTDTISLLSNVKRNNMWCKHVFGD